MQQSNRVGICDPVPVFRSGLRSVLAEADFVVDEPEDVLLWAECNYASSMVLSLHDDTYWTLLDDLRSIKTDVAVVVLLPEPNAYSYRQALRKGAYSALPRHAPGVEILDVVHAALQQRVILPSEVVRALASDQLASSSALIEEEHQWLRELAKGATVDDLAWRSGYSRRTMFRRLQGVYRQLGATRRAEALLEATRQGLI